MLRQIQVDHPIVRLYLSPQQTYFALHVVLEMFRLRVMVYRFDTLELLHQHEEQQRQFLYVSFDEQEQQMLVFTNSFRGEKPDKITIFRINDFKVMKELSFTYILDGAFFSNQRSLLLFDESSHMIKSFDLETENEKNIMKYDEGGQCSTIYQVRLVKDIRKFNPHFNYESINQEKALIVLSSQTKIFGNIKIIKQIKYDKDDNKIIKTSRLFSQYNVTVFRLFWVRMLENSQFKIIYWNKSAVLINRNKILRKYPCDNHDACSKIKLPMKSIIIPQRYSITFL